MCSVQGTHLSTVFLRAVWQEMGGREPTPSVSILSLTTPSIVTEAGEVAGSSLSGPIVPEPAERQRREDVRRPSTCAAAPLVRGRMVLVAMLVWLERNRVSNHGLFS